MRSNKLFSPLMLACAVMILPGLAAAAAGQLDSSFGKGGIFVANNVGISNTTAAAVAFDSQGRIVIAGQAPISNGSEQPAVLRLNSNGTLDTSFGNSGVASINLDQGGGEIATSLVLQANGKIVIGVSFGTADGQPALALARFDANGALDMSFGDAGKTLLFVGEADTEYLVQQPDGKLLAGGGFLMARTSSEGALDASFGQNGIAPLVAPADSILLQSDGKILGLSGPEFLNSTPPLTLTGLPEPSTIVRYNEDGTVDSSFGTLGRSASIAGISAAQFQSNGDIVAVGTILSKSLISSNPAINPPNTEFVVSRYNSNGGIDDTFGSAGAVLTTFGSAPLASANSLVIQSNGDIIAAGEVETSDPPGQAPSASFGLARYASAGVLDTTFGSAGKVLTPITASSGTSAAGIAAVVLDAEGRLVAVGNLSVRGSSNLIGGTSIVVARYLTK